MNDGYINIYGRYMALNDIPSNHIVEGDIYVMTGFNPLLNTFIINSQRADQTSIMSMESVLNNFKLSENSMTTNNITSLPVPVIGHVYKVIVTDPVIGVNTTDSVIVFKLNQSNSTLTFMVQGEYVSRTCSFVDFDYLTGFITHNVPKVVNGKVIESVDPKNLDNTPSNDAMSDRDRLKKFFMSKKKLRS